MVLIMYNTLSIALLALEFASPACSYHEHVDTVSEGPSVLFPINVRHYEAATGLRQRDDQDFSDLDPNTQSQLIYGRPGGNHCFNQRTRQHRRLTMTIQVMANSSLQT